MADSRLADAAHASFARHETFPPRFGWLHRAYVQVRDNPETFLAPDAPVLLGVGKNMVNAMRFWSKAFKLTEEYRGGNAKTRAHLAAPTWKARWLLDEQGADPYLEDPGSLWLLHWWLLCPPCWVPTWYVAFHLAGLTTFTAAQLTDVTVQHVALAGLTVRGSDSGVSGAPVEASIAKDVDCLIKMYARDRASAANSPGSFEDLLACPFRELGLIESTLGVGERKSRAWRFASTTDSRIPGAVLAYACLDYAARFGQAPGSISLARLAGEPGGPGRAFRMGEPDLAASLSRVMDVSGPLRLIEAVGQRSLAYADDPHVLAWRLLDAHYGEARRAQTPTPATWRRRYPHLTDADDPIDDAADAVADETAQANLIPGPTS